MRSKGVKLEQSWLIVFAALAVAVALVSFGTVRARRSAYVARLPAIPVVPGQSAVIRSHLLEADRLAREQPTSADAVGALGLAYHADMFYDEAQRAYDVAETLSGSDWRWAYYRALARGARGDTEALIIGLHRVVTAAPGFSPALWQLGDAEFKAGHYDRAKDAWRRASTLAEPSRQSPPAGWPAHRLSAPISAYARLSLGRLALIEGDADGSRIALEELTAKEPRFGPAFRLLATAYAALGRADDAKRALRVADRTPAYDPNIDPMIEALVYESRSSTFLLQQAATADLTTNGPWRERLIRRALEFDPDNPDALFELASLLRVLRRYDEALPLLERHQQLAPGDFQVLADIGRCLSGLGRFGDAEAMLRRALEGLDDANTRYDLGFVLNRLGRVSESMVEYRRALERNPNHRDALNNLAVDLAGQRRLAEATLYLQRLVTIDPDNVDAHTNLGALLLAQGHRDLAAREFQTAVRLDPDDARARQGLRSVEQ
jgi:tetratricopeptide (TPR) repeat protein